MSDTRLRDHLRTQLADLKTQGLYKTERCIQTPQHAALFLIAPTRFRTLHDAFSVGFSEAMSMAAHPTLTDRRNAQHQCIVGNVTLNDCTGAHEGVPSNRHSANDRRVGADRRSLSDQRSFVFTLSINPAARIDYVGEDH